MMEKRTLVIHFPVIHRGYLDFLFSNKDKISKIMIPDQKMVEQFSGFTPDIAAIRFSEIKKILKFLRFSNTYLLKENNLGNALLKEKLLLFVNDEVSRKIVSRFKLKKKTKWASVFLRWDKSSIITEKEPLGIRITKELFAVKMMNRAYREADKSGDRWRHVGAVLVKNEAPRPDGRGIFSGASSGAKSRRSGKFISRSSVSLRSRFSAKGDKKVLLKGYNRGLPDEYSACQLGDIRSYFKAGEKPDLYGTIHAEQLIISEAAKKGISVKGSDLYVTHFPCPVCAKLIAVSGIKKVYFSEGWSNYLGEKAIRSAKIDIIRVLNKYN